MIQAKNLGTRLSSKETADRFLHQCRRELSSNDILTINMYGVKSVSEGFATDCFGKLYIDAREIGASIKFSQVKDHIKPTLLKGVKNAIVVYS